MWSKFFSEVKLKNAQGNFPKSGHLQKKHPKIHKMCQHNGPNPLLPRQRLPFFLKPQGLSMFKTLVKNAILLVGS